MCCAAPNQPVNKPYPIPVSPLQQNCRVNMDPGWMAKNPGPQIRKVSVLTASRTRNLFFLPAGRSAVRPLFCSSSVGWRPVVKLNVRAYESPAHLWCLYHPLHPLAQVESLQHTCTKLEVAGGEIGTEEIKGNGDQIRAKPQILSLIHI